MRKFLLLFVLLVAFLTGCCVHNHNSGAESRTHTAEDLSRYRLISHLENSTVALQTMDDEEHTFYTFCTGVWISQHKILTAKHCVREHEFDSARDNIGKLIRFRTTAEINEAGVTYPPIYSSSSPHYAIVIAADEANDLAIISSLDEVHHEIAQVSREKLYDGQNVHIMGHTAGLEYSYVNGVISKHVRELRKEGYVKVIQISTSAWKGNSGGGAFDAKGNLLGICSFLSGHGPNILFFIHRDEIVDFFDREAIDFSF